MSDEDGVTAIEYALIASIIAVALIATFTGTAGGICKVFNTVTTKLGGTAATCPT
ncbi:MAG: Flp family type IVb pilin [Methylophilales bacterium]|nr:Flp family type IVb pilin [Methylophilales bacterium]